MPHTFASLLVHVVFSTRQRVPDQSPDLSGRLFPYLGGIVRELSGVARIVNRPADHVHLLLSIPAALVVCVKQNADSAEQRRVGFSLPPRQVP